MTEPIPDQIEPPKTSYGKPVVVYTAASTDFPPLAPAEQTSVASQSAGTTLTNTVGTNWGYGSQTVKAREELEIRMNERINAIEAKVIEMQQFQENTLQSIENLLDKKLAQFNSPTLSTKSQYHPSTPSMPPKVHNSATSYVTFEQLNVCLAPILDQLQEIQKVLKINPPPVVDDSPSKRVRQGATPVRGNVTADMDVELGVEDPDL